MIRILSKKKPESEMHLALENARNQHSDDSCLVACAQSCLVLSYLSVRLLLPGLGLEPEGRTSSPLLLPSLLHFAF
jgi:hypothetical protein